MLKMRGKHAGIVYPDSVVLAGLQAVYNLRNATGWSVSPTKILGDGTGGTTAPPSGWTLSSTLGLTTTADDPAPLTGYQTNGRPIILRHARPIVTQNKITNDGSYPTAAGYGIGIGNGAQNLDGVVISYNEIDGQGSPSQNGTISNGILSRTDLTYTTGPRINNNYFHGLAGDGMQIFMGDAQIEYNRLEKGGYNPLAHYDPITYGNNKAGTTSYIRYNYINSDWETNVWGRTAYIGFGVASWSPTGIVHCTHNICKGYLQWGDPPRGDNLEKAFYPISAIDATPDDVIFFENNLIERHDSSWAWVHISSDGNGGAAFASFSGNRDYSDGSPITWP
jgi:hypothetical protein